MIVKVIPNPTVQQIGKGYVKYLFPQKTTLQILKIVLGEITMTQDNT